MRGYKVLSFAGFVTRLAPNTSNKRKTGRRKKKSKMIIQMMMKISMSLTLKGCLWKIKVSLERKVAPFILYSRVPLVPLSVLMSHFISLPSL